MRSQGPAAELSDRRGLHAFEFAEATGGIGPLASRGARPDRADRHAAGDANERPHILREEMRLRGIEGGSRPPLRLAGE
jgi:hypothetical protein